jgi:hypothetical protein
MSSAKLIMFHAAELPPIEEEPIEIPEVVEIPKRKRRIKKGSKRNRTL